ncbi:alpha/beta fold hydrolase [Nocardioides marmorisolisilvae]|nr:alpha/beta fold hydrolase [Nocardioides marmorisolisilvae]
MQAFFKYAEHVAPGYAGRVANDLWFTAPPRMGDLPVPAGGRSFSVLSQGATVVGQVWGEGFRQAQPAQAAQPTTARAPKTVYLMHGWGGRGAQFGALVEPLVEAGYQVVMFDAPSHGDSGIVERTGERRTHGIEFARALDAVFDEFGPAEAVIAHSLGTISTYLDLRFGWLGTNRLVFIAPMTDAMSLFDGFQAALGFGPRTRAAMEAATRDFTGLPVTEFDATLQSRYLDEPLPTFVVHDRDDRQTPYADAKAFASAVGAEFMGTEGLGHRKVLRDPEVIKRVVEFVSTSSTTDGGDGDKTSGQDDDWMEVAG